MLIAYASIYGHTENAAETLALALREAGVKRVAVYDVSVTHVSELVSEAFRYSKLALLAPTYNMDLYPAMEAFLLDLKAHALKNRTVALVENGSWAPNAVKLMRGVLEGMKDMRVLEESVTIRSAGNGDTLAAIEALARALAKA